MICISGCTRVFVTLCWLYLVPVSRLLPPCWRVGFRCSGYTMRAWAPGAQASVLEPRELSGGTRAGALQNVGLIPGFRLH